MANYKPLELDLIHARYLPCQINGLKNKHPNNPRKAMYLLPIGYYYSYVGERLVTTHRVVWALHNGDPGNFDIDHIDRDKKNNKIGNLRLATRSQNNENMVAQANNNSSGMRGITFDKSRGKWAASLKWNGRYVLSGRYDTLEEAIAARKRAEETWLSHKPLVI